MKRYRIERFPHSSMVLLIAAAWLAVIAVLHVTFNKEPHSRRKILMGYMPVITNLAAPLVDAASRESDPSFEAVKFGSFAEMGEAFRAGHIQVAFVIAPLAVALHRQGIRLKVVYIGNRHESTLVVRKDLPCRSFADLEGKTIAVPMRFSGHMLALRRYGSQLGMGADSIRIVEIPPPDMAVALASGGIDGYFVGEPFAAKSIVAGNATALLNVEDIWPKFICNLMIVREDLLESHPEWVQTLVTAAARSGLWAQNHVDEAIGIACVYWGQDPVVVRYAFSNPEGRIRFDLFVPVVEEMQEIAREMHRFGLVDDQVEVRSIVDDRFAREVPRESIGAFKEILLPAR